MKAIFKKIRGVLLADAYLQSKLSTPSKQIHVVRIADVRSPIFPCITFEPIINAPDPWNLTYQQFAFMVEVHAKNNYEECEDIWYNQDDATLEEYAYAQGARTLLHGQKYIGGNVNILRMWCTAEAFYDFNERTKTYFLKAPFHAEVTTTAALRTT